MKKNKYQHELLSMESEIAELKRIIDQKEEKIRDLLTQLAENQSYTLQLQQEINEAPIFKFNKN